MFNDQKFLTNLRNNTAKVSARSGGNVHFAEDTAKSYGSKSVQGLNDAVKFFQKTFKVTPRVTIDNENNEMPWGANAVTYSDGVAGESKVAFENVTADKEDKQKDYVENENLREWTVKNARQNPLAYTPIHEFAHAFAFQLLENDEESPDGEDHWDLFKNALKDIGVGNESKDFEMKQNGTDQYGDPVYEYPAIKGKDYDNMKNALKNVSGYASSEPDKFVFNPYEAVAEAITDYYYNGEKAAPFSRAVVKRLQKNSATYALRQAGGIVNNPKRMTKNETPSETFRRNFRRYNVIQ